MSAFDRQEVADAASQAHFCFMQATPAAARDTTDAESKANSSIGTLLLIPGQNPVDALITNPQAGDFNCRFASAARTFENRTSCRSSARTAVTAWVKSGLGGLIDTLFSQPSEAAYGMPE